MLYKVFIDESGKKEYITPYSKDFIDNPPGFEKYENFWWDNYFVLCGVRVKQDNLKLINPKINQLKESYFGTCEVEVKSDWLRNPYQRKKHYLKPYNISSENLDKFGSEFMDLIAKHKEHLKTLAVVFDKRYYGDAKRSSPGGIPLLKTTQVLFERLQYAGGYHIVVFDQMESSLKITTGQHGKILNVFRENKGMEKVYVEGYDRLSDVKFMESKNENFLQIADVCAYNVFRQFAQFGREWAGGQKLNLYPYFDQVRCNFFFHPATKQVRGYGLVLLPDIQKINWNLLEGCFDNKKTPPK